MCTRICGSQDEIEATLARIRLIPCPHCKSVGNLIRHGFLKGYDSNQQLQTQRTQRVFCSNRNRASGCGRTFAIRLATEVKRLFISADQLWKFLKQACVTNNKQQAFQTLNCGLNASAPYRIWKRFQNAQSAIRTALYSYRASPAKPSRDHASNPEASTLDHMEASFAGHLLSPISAFQLTFQTFFL